MSRAMMSLSSMLMLLWYTTGVRVIKKPRVHEESRVSKKATLQLQHGSPSGHDPELLSQASPPLWSSPSSVLDSHSSVAVAAAPVANMQTPMSSKSEVAATTETIEGHGFAEEKMGTNAPTEIASATSRNSSRQLFINSGWRSADPNLCSMQNSQQTGCKKDACICDWYQQCFPKHSSNVDIGVCYYSVKLQVGLSVCAFAGVFLVIALIRAFCLAASDAGKRLVTKRPL